MKPESKNKGLQGEGPPDDAIGRSNAVFVVAVAGLLVISIAVGLIWWLTR